MQNLPWNEKQIICLRPHYALEPNAITKNYKDIKRNIRAGLFHDNANLVFLKGNVQRLSNYLDIFLIPTHKKMVVLLYLRITCILIGLKSLI